MTTERAREFAASLWPPYGIVGQKTDFVDRLTPLLSAHYAKVRREALEEVRDRAVAVPGVNGRDWSHRETANKAAFEQRRLFRAMLDEMIADTGPVSASPGDVSVSTSGSGVVVGRDSPNAPAARPRSRPAHPRGGV